MIIKIPKDIYLYNLKDPREEFYGIIRYIGKGTGRRLFQHHRKVKAGLTAHGNKELTLWLQELIKLDLEPLYEIYPETYKTHVEAYAQEGNLIKTIGLDKLYNLHANDQKYNSFQEIDVEVPLTQQTWGIVYNTRLFTNSPISHAQLSFETAIIGIQKNANNLLSCAKNIKRVKEDDIIFLYDTIPNSGIHLIGKALNKFCIKEDNNVWTNNKSQESFSCQLLIQPLAFYDTIPFNLQKRTKDWPPRSPIINLTKKQNFTKEVLDYFNLKL